MILVLKYFVHTINHITEIDTIDNSVRDKLIISSKVILLALGSKKILIERNVIKITTDLHISLFHHGAFGYLIIINNSGNERTKKIETIRINGYSKNQPESAIE